MSVLLMLRRVGQLLLSYGPSLFAVYMPGSLLHYYAIEWVGWVGAYTAIGGALLFPLVVLIRLFALVAMLLIVRDGLISLRAIAPLPTEPGERRKHFGNAMLGAVIAFVAFYSAWGYLKDDYLDYQARVLYVWSGNLWTQAAKAVASHQVSAGGSGVPDLLALGPITGIVIVAAFAVRWTYGRYRDRLGKSAVFGGVYLEALWVVLSAVVVSTGVKDFSTWFNDRQGMVWLADFRTWLGQRADVLGAVWDGIGWVIGQVAGTIVEPLAWLTIIGVVYGQAISPEAVKLHHKMVDRARARFDRVPDWAQRRSADVWNQVSGRVRPIWNAMVLMLRSGPVMIGCYILLYAVVKWGESLLDLGVSRMFGPQPMTEFWMPYAPLITMFVPLIIEPIRIVLVASAYEGVLGRLKPIPAPTRESAPLPAAGPASATA